MFETLRPEQVAQPAAAVDRLRPWFRRCPKRGQHPQNWRVAEPPLRHRSRGPPRALRPPSTPRKTRKRWGGPRMTHGPPFCLRRLPISAASVPGLGLRRRGCGKTTAEVVGSAQLGARRFAQRCLGVVGPAIPGVGPVNPIPARCPFRFSLLQGCSPANPVTGSAKPTEWEIILTRIINC